MTVEPEFDVIEAEPVTLTETSPFNEPEVTSRNKAVTTSSIEDEIRQENPRDYSSTTVPLEQVEKLVKVSTGCGPSPDQEIEAIFANESHEQSMKSFTPLREIPSRSSKVSIGTSPPPQSTSTQVESASCWPFSSQKIYFEPFVDLRCLAVRARSGYGAFSVPGRGSFRQSRPSTKSIVRYNFKICGDGDAFAPLAEPAELFQRAPGEQS